MGNAIGRLARPSSSAATPRPRPTPCSAGSTPSMRPADVARPPASDRPVRSAVRDRYVRVPGRPLAACGSRARTPCARPARRLLPSKHPQARVPHRVVPQAAAVRSTQAGAGSAPKTAFVSRSSGNVRRGLRVGVMRGRCFRALSGDRQSRTSPHAGDHARRSGDTRAVVRAAAAGQPHHRPHGGVCPAGQGLVIGISFLDHLAALRLVGDTAYLAAIDRQQREALALLVLEATAGRRLPARASVVRRGRQGDRHGVVAVRSWACSLRDGRTRRARSGTCEPTSTASAGSATDG